MKRKFWMWLMVFNAAICLLGAFIFAVKPVHFLGYAIGLALSCLAFLGWMKHSPNNQ